jgi:uncharacterized protein YkwD
LSVLAVMVVTAPAAASSGPELGPAPLPRPVASTTTLTPATAGPIDSTDRQAVRDGFDNDYQPVADRLAAARGYWSGSVSGCHPGAVTTSVKDDMLAALNFYRALAGLEPVTRDADLDEQAQAAALIMDANNSLSHFPSSAWTCWTQAGYDGAGNSNLALAVGGYSSFLRTLMEGFMLDPGLNNFEVGHRRWFLWPAVRGVGFGATTEAVAVWVTANGISYDSTTAPEYTAWPTSGYFPIELTTSRWSLSNNHFLDADMSNATVSMSHEGSAVAVIPHYGPIQYGYSENITWDIVDSRFAGWVNSGEDQTFEVTVDGILVGGETVSHTYSVTLAGPWAGPVGTFKDDDDSVFQADIEKLYASGITQGCNPPTNNRFCPDDPVTRGQMAAFLSRALALPAGSGDHFDDDNTSVFQAEIEKLFASGITKGCTSTSFCPADPVTRGQMAAFLVRAGLAG